MKRNASIRLYHLDDDPLLLAETSAALTAVQQPTGFQVESFAQPSAFLSATKTERPDVALVDIHLGENESDGVAIIRELRHLAPRALIIALSGKLDEVKRSMLAGADDFISKLSGPDEIVLRLTNILRLRQPEIHEELAAQRNSEHQIAIGATMKEIRKRVPAILSSAISAVHILGESGTGKEVVASLFESALNKGQPFIKVNCGAIAETLVERELFGHVKGAYTGASGDQLGYLEAASGGWIFLDEVAMLTTSAQTALLRVIENQEVMRVGAHKARRIDLRVISACNEPLEDLVQKGKFRKDLWQRLRETVIELPPLRQRRGEIKELIKHFSQSERGGPYVIPSETESLLLNYDWSQGNVRELRNCIRAMTEKHVDKRLTPMSIPSWIWEALGPEPTDGTITKVAASTLQVPYDGEAAFETLCELLLLELLSKIRGNVSNFSLQRAATVLGMPKSTLATKLRKISDRSSELDTRIKGIFKSDR